MTRPTWALSAASTRLENHLVLVTGRNRSGRGAKRIPAKCTMTSAPATARDSVSGFASSAWTGITFGKLARSGGSAFRWYINRKLCPFGTRNRASRLPKLPAAPVIRIVRGDFDKAHAGLSNLRLRTSGVSPRVKASEGRKGLELRLAFQVPRALARRYLLYLKRRRHHLVDALPRPVPFGDAVPDLFALGLN